MVRSTIEMGHAAGLISIAEGVEDPDQAALLDQLGCDRIQGYLYSMPTPASHIAATVTRLQKHVHTAVATPQQAPVHYPMEAET